MRTKVGFTLAEILITIGIIGVVAAMTLPALATKIQKKMTVAKLQKTFAEISNAAKLAIDESGGAIFEKNDRMKSRERFQKYIEPHLKVSATATLPGSKIYYQSSGARETMLNVMRSTGTEYTLLSGASIIVSDDQAWSTPNKNGSVGISFLIDLNGYKNPPNKFGRDTFFMVINSELGPYLYYSDDGEAGTVQRTREQLIKGPSTCNYQCSKKGRGMWCGALIQKDGWKISKDYPW